MPAGAPPHSAGLLRSHRCASNSRAICDEAGGVTSSRPLAIALKSSPRLGSFRARRRRVPCSAYLIFGVILALLPAAALAQESPAPGTVEIGVIRQLQEEPPWSTSLTRAPDDEGFAGARLALAENQTTGRITKQGFK